MSCQSQLRAGSSAQQRLIAVILVCSVAVVSCALDSRTFEVIAGAAGQAGALGASAGSENAGRAGDEQTAGAGRGGASLVGSAGRAGSGGEAGQPEQLVAGCADLDGNGIADCTETLVTNPDFKSDVSGWESGADPDTTISWDPRNSWPEPSSGSALVASTGVIDANAIGAALRGASQCVSVAGKRLVTVYANAFVDNAQDQQGHAEIDVFFFDTADCTEMSVDGFSTPQPLGKTVGSWITIKAGAISAVTTKSALVKIAVSKPFRAPAFEARFDNVLVRSEMTQ